ncbi:MAG TPA: pilus assembly protein TadG-related protein [Acidimicrobiia bacterium]|nr:pilus assembly protein TadG-related protein [Acidimicrobiia bacterium]
MTVHGVPRTRAERGSVTVWVLSLTVAVAALGGLAIDVGRAFVVRRELATVADAAAVAGASGVDVASLRVGGAALDPQRVDALVAVAVASHSAASAIDEVRVVVTDAQRVEVTVRGSVRVGLLGLLLDASVLAVEVHASAEPRRLP